ncbi:MAG TPA: hypothetical protein VMA34_09050 [Terracidiphilus sp.]|nr:hypothetical protein [Terracidiphilus sp.]
MAKAQEGEMVLVKAKPVGAGTPVDRIKSGPKPHRPEAAAIDRCMKAWQQAYQAEMDSCAADARTMGEDPETAQEFDQAYAGHFAKEAYRKAMPLLAGYEGIRDYIACTAYGILIGAIPPHKCSQLLYAAQVALNALHFKPAEEPVESAGAEVEESPA